MNIMNFTFHQNHSTLYFCLAGDVGSGTGVTPCGLMQTLHCFITTNQATYTNKFLLENVSVSFLLILWYIK